MILYLYLFNKRKKKVFYKEYYPIFNPKKNYFNSPSAE